MACVRSGAAPGSLSPHGIAYQAARSGDRPLPLLPLTASGHTPIFVRRTNPGRILMTRSFQQELVGVFGQPVAENPTQAMIEAAFAAMGLGWRNLTIEVAPADLAGAVRGAKAMGFRGFNCTIPHK